MAPFAFPDPNIQSTVIAPNGEVWEFIDGAWEVVDHGGSGSTSGDHHDDDDHADAFAVKSLEQEVDQNEEQLQAVSTALFNLQTKVDSLEDLDIQNALSALAIAQADIIELKSKVSALELTSFLILE